jgi:hypothetical protein
MEQKELDKMDKENNDKKSNVMSLSGVKEIKTNLPNKISLTDLIKSYEAKIDFSALDDNPIVSGPLIKRRKYVPDSR